MAQHGLALPRRLDTRMDDMLPRLARLEPRGTVRDEDAVPDRIAALALRQRGSRIEKCLDLTDPGLPPAA